MKLNLQPKREPRISSRDALGLEAEQPKSEFFDPRVDFPRTEMERLRQLATGSTEDVHQISPLLQDDLYNGWWLSFVDPEFKALLESNQEFRDILQNEFSTYYTKQVSKNPKQNKEPLVATGLRAVRLFPSLRPQIQRDLVNTHLPELLRVVHPAPDFGVAIFYLATMLELYPEKRTDWLKVYSVEPATVVKRLAQELITHKNSVNAPMVANTLLVFPELRSQILSFDLPVGKWKQALRNLQIPFTVWGQTLAFELTVIGAEDARIDETGQIQLQLKSRTALKAPRPLPPRSLP